MSEFVHDAASAPAPAQWQITRSPSANDRLRDTIDRWGVALEHGDVAEVARIVRQSHHDRNEDAETGRMGPMVGSAGPTTDTNGFPMNFDRK
ncbi:MAG: hypothetical protein ABIR32_05360 [Ilumatobacteraceae bacterium]